MKLSDIADCKIRLKRGPERITISVEELVRMIREEIDREKNHAAMVEMGILPALSDEQRSRIEELADEELLKQHGSGIIIKALCPTCTDAISKAAPGGITVLCRACSEKRAKNPDGLFAL